MKMSSPDSVHTVGARAVDFTVRASPMSSAFDRCTTSGRPSDASQRASFATSFRWCPRSPSSVETVSAPRSAGRVPPVRPDSHRSSAGASSHRSKSAGVCRKSGTYSWSQTFTPPMTTRDSATFSSSVVVGT